MNHRRTVRTSQACFQQLDIQLGDTRRPKGEPSATDFLVELIGVEIDLDR